MKVFSLAPRDYFGSNTFVIESNGVGVVIDPSVSYSDFFDSYPEKQISIKYILITHAHFDHFLEIDSWREATGADVIVGEADATALSDAKLNCYFQFMNCDHGYNGPYTIVKGGDVIKFGDSEINVIETPGHSPGSVSFLCDGELFVGDVLFAGGGFGRVDLPGGDFRVLMQSIKKLLSYPKDTKLYCGHGEETSIFQLKTKFI